MRRAAAAAGVLLLAGFLGAALWRGAPRTVVDEVARAAPARPFAARTSLAPSYRPCPAGPAPAGGTVAVSGCGTGAGAPPALAALAEAGASADPDTLRASALAALVWWDGEEASLDAAVERLTRALRLAARPVPVLVDLSGAHLVRAERTQNPRDLLQGLEYALEALEAEPRHRAARFNAALALDALGLDDRAALAWDAYLAVDARSGWAAEARERGAALVRRPPPPVSPSPASSAAEVRAFAAAHPQEARLLGMDTVLGQWGERIEAGDTAGARAFLGLAEGLGAALEARGGDATLADLVRAIDAAAGDSAATRRLAAAHRAYADGQVAFTAFAFDSARGAFTRAAAADVPSPVLVRSATLFRIASIAYGNLSTADTALRTLHPQMDTVRHPALAARALWMHGTVLLRRQRYASSREALAKAGRLFNRAGEREYTGVAWAIGGEAAYLQRDTLAGYLGLHRGLQRLRSYRTSPWLYNPLLVLAYAAQADGMPRAAAAVHEENIAFSLPLGDPVREIDIRLARARQHAVVGVRAGGAADLARATALLDSISADARALLVSRVHYSRAMSVDARATAQLDTVVTYFAETDQRIWLLPTLLRRAELRLAAGDLDGGTADLESATAHIRGLSDSLHHAALRSAVVEGARGRFDQLVMLHLRRGDAAAALAALERGRASFAPTSPITARNGRPRAPAGHVAVEYALIGDTLLAWTVRGERVELARRRVDAAALLRRIERVGAALETPGRAAAAEPELARLYDLLVRPVRERLGPAGTPLVILADGEVAAIPFAALVDRATGRRLLEDHPLRFAPTLADAAREVPREGGAARPALLVADPAFDRARHPTLDPLAGARAEVAALRAVYPEHRLLDGASATPDALAGEATRADVVHYAGHAVFDDARPERSYLVLAGGRMDAGAVNELRLDGVRVVVLSACRTLRARSGRTGGFAGLAGALLGAGAGGVVGSAWEVDDRLAAPLMLEFHRAYRGSGDAAAALREAQLRMLRAPDPALRSPAAWAGFRYVGGGPG